MATLKYWDATAGEYKTILAAAKGDKGDKGDTGPQGLPGPGGIGVNIVDYGAVGDGATDDTAAINNAIAALGADGGQVLVPAGNYRVEGTINLVDGLSLVGESSRSSRLYKPNDGNLLVGVDTDRFSVRDIYLVGPGQGVGTGNALTITRSALDAITAVDLVRLNITSFGGNGIDIDGSLANTFERVYVTAVGGTGIHLHHSGVNAGATSSTLQNCFVAGATTGIRLDECVYMSLLSCAVDDTTTAYHLSTCFAVAMVGCGAEVATNAVIADTACRAITITSFYMLGMTGSGIYTNDAQVFLTGLYEEPGTGTYSVEATGPGLVKYSNMTVTKPITGNVVDMQGYLLRSGGTMTGPMYVQAPTADLNPATKKYVDDSIPASTAIGFARGTFPSQNILSGTELNIGTQVTAIGSVSELADGSGDYYLPLLTGWWTVTMQVRSPGGALNSGGQRAYITITCPSGDMRASIGTSEDRVAVSATDYFDGSTDIVRFKAYQTTGSTMDIVGVFRIRYLGPEA